MTSTGQLPLSIALDDAMTRDNWLCRPETAALERWLFVDGAAAYVGGESGVGKSHLLQALCHASVGGLYLPLDELLDMPPMALLEGTEGAPLLAIDALQSIVGHDGWQEALFHLFNRAQQAGTRLVVAATRSPTMLEPLLPDLRSRLTSLPLFALPRFTSADLDALLILRGERRGLSLSSEVRSWLLRRVPRSPGDLIAVLDILDRESLARGRPVTVPLLRELTLLSRDP